MTFIDKDSGAEWEEVDFKREFENEGRKIQAVIRPVKKPNKHTYSLVLSGNNKLVFEQVYDLTEDQAQATKEAIEALMEYLTNPVEVGESLPSYEVDFHALENKAIAARNAMKGDK